MTIDKLYIFDADATLRVCTVHGQPCPHTHDEWMVIPWAKERLARIDWTRSGFGIVSNQAGIAKGHLTERTAIELLWDLASEFVSGNVYDDAGIRLCPHASGAGCECRKPKPKMILDVIEAYGVDRERAIYVGDLDTDREAAANARVEFAWIWDFCGRTREEWVGWLAEQNELHRNDFSRFGLAQLEGHVDDVMRIIAHNMGGTPDMQEKTAREILAILQRNEAS